MLPLRLKVLLFSKAIPIWIKKSYFKKFLFDKLKEHDKNYTSDKNIFSDHHLSHAASAFSSPFEVNRSDCRWCWRVAQQQ